MSGTEARTGGTATELRRAFDRAFAELPDAGAQQFRNFLAIRLGGDGYALDLAEVAGLFADKPITRLPQSLPEFLGIAGFRGTAVPVYDLRVLLGYPATARPRWLVTASALPVALAFDTFDRHFRVSTDAIAQAEGADGARRHVRHALRASDMVRPILDMASVLAVITKLASRGATQKGQ